MQNKYYVWLMSGFGILAFVINLNVDVSYTQGNMGSCIRGRVTYLNDGNIALMLFFVGMTFTFIEPIVFKSVLEIKQINRACKLTTNIQFEVRTQYMIPQNSLFAL